MIENDVVALALLKRKIFVDRGFHSHRYKDKCLRRRIAVRMRARGKTTYDGYAALLDHDPEEYERLLETLTINVTRFFRDAAMWTCLEQAVLPHLPAPATGPLRIWSAGCASGEELYSVAILLHEQGGRWDDSQRVEMLGTDIDEPSLALARAGLFPALSMTETAPERRKRWFSPGPPHSIDPRLRRGVRFERADLISDRPAARQHLILCRNVIIYLDRAIQQELFEKFYDVLEPGGFLVLGKVETLLGPARSRFQVVDARQRIFRKPAGEEGGGPSREPAIQFARA